MTEPKVVRYNGLEQDDEGVYVRYSDYEALAARVEELEIPDGYFKGSYMICLDANRALRSENEHFESENTRLLAENQRLREDLEDCRSDNLRLDPPEGL